MRCERCGATNHDGATSCGNCGAPLVRGGSSAAFAAVAVASLVLVVGAIVALTFLSGSDDESVTATSAPTSVEPGTTASDTTAPDTTAPDTTAPTTEAPTTTSAPTTTMPVDPNEEAADALADLIEGDRPTIDGLLGRWVPQISAKTDGTEWEGVVYDHVRILNEHEGLRDAYGAVLASGAEYNFLRGGEPMDGWYFSLVPEASGDAQGALDWCVAEGIDRDNCAAKLISDDRSLVPNFELQP